MAKPEERDGNLRLADLNPSLLLAGKTPRLLDEWQIAPKLWDAVRFEVDHRQETGQFILTGSAVPADKESIFHTGTSRIPRLRMRPMTLFESGESNGSIRLSALFDGEQQLSGLGELDIKTVQSYLDALKKIFVVEDLPAWNPRLHSATAIRTTDTRYFTDPSVGAAPLGIGPKDLLTDLETFGILFETLCVRDLRVYTEALGGTVYHYRDKNGLECDAVLHLRD